MNISTQINSVTSKLFYTQLGKRCFGLSCTELNSQREYLCMFYYKIYTAVGELSSDLATMKNSTLTVVNNQVERKLLVCKIMTQD